MTEKEKISIGINESITKALGMGYTPLYCANYGSHNYNLNISDEEYKSDVDTKLIIIPSLDDLIRDKEPVSKVIDISTGQCDIKDVRSFIITLNKANVQFLETLCADDYQFDIGLKNEVDYMRNHLEDLARECIDALMKSSYGMATQKRTALCHRYPTIEWKIDKWGYDGKQLHHIIRLYDFLVNFVIKEKTFKESITYIDEERIKYLIDVKKNKMELAPAIELADEYCNKIKMLVDENLGHNNGDYYKKQYLELSYSLIKDSIKEELK